MIAVGAYTHARPDGRVFYVGKGTEKRAFNLRRQNKHHTNIVRKYGIENIIVGWVECEDHEEAFELEKHLIATCREIGIKLCNRTDGGDGTRNPCAETRAKIGAAHKGKVMSSATREKIGLAALGRNKGRHISDETRAKIRSANIGKKLSDETRAKMRASAKGKNAGKVRSAETRAKLRSAHLGMKASDKTRAKMSASAKSAWKRRRS